VDDIPLTRRQAQRETHLLDRVDLCVLAVSSSVCVSSGGVRVGGGVDRGAVGLDSSVVGAVSGSRTVVGVGVDSGVSLDCEVHGDVGVTLRGGLAGLVELGHAVAFFPLIVRIHDGDGDCYLLLALPNTLITAFANPQSRAATTDTMIATKTMTTTV
jgi:hypothetical protein